MTKTVGGAMAQQRQRDQGTANRPAARIFRAIPKGVRHMETFQIQTGLSHPVFGRAQWWLLSGGALLKKAPVSFFGPMKASVTTLTEQLPLYWERLQKPLIKMEQQAVLSEEKIQAEVTTEIAQILGLVAELG